MNNIIETMLNKYNPQNSSERENAIKEIIQGIVLAGLSRGGFFEKAAFYGGTCLRIFHGLNRFSEDLDFALISKNQNFKLSDYFPFIKKELNAYGIDMDFVQKANQDAKSNIQSAFIKKETQILLMHFFPKSEEAKKAIKNQNIRIKFEIDMENPDGGLVETKYRLAPSPYEIKIFDDSTLFAGKIHAVICREYKNRVKGRDYYDYLFYRAKETKINLAYLENKLKNTGKISKDTKLTIDIIKELLDKKFKSVNFEAAKEDVNNFIKDKDSLKLWSTDLFLSTIEGLQTNKI